MTAVQVLVTEAELADWLTDTIGPKIVNDYDATTALLTVFDLAAKDGPSLNNRHQIVELLSPTPFHDRWGPAVHLTAQAAAQHLVEAFRITRKPADYDRILVDLPMPRVVNRHQCPFCRRFTRADLRQVQNHMTRCWINPALRTCKTCTHHQDASGTPGSPDEWLEACTNPAGPEEDYQFPVLHCPIWEGTT
ncbi:hypothetical protein [Streptomyces pseudovenezuelae]|uniref:hypothetical protein n=1 Tax=Streptomyces pseudovenezuelae TaxID=67350 RepID=UPI002E811DA9|nr:hypothetical protein [Streptomyces pseudovenezuelae]WUA94489.1 hypothetical protein OHO81_44755 [Streptomyces pseudovenezuelae]